MGVIVTSLPPKGLPLDRKSDVPIQLSRGLAGKGGGSSIRRPKSNVQSELSDLWWHMFELVPTPNMTHFPSEVIF